MPNDDDDYEGDRPARSPKKGGIPLWVWIAGGVAILGFLGCGGVVMLFVVGSHKAAQAVQKDAIQVQQANTTDAAKAAQSKAGKLLGTAPQTMTRDEFRAKVIGKTEAEILALLGRPESTNQVGDMPYWRYDRRTVDPFSGKTDISTTIDFRNGVVVSVGF